MAASGTIVSNLGPEFQTPKEASGLNAHETHAAASLLGQFRTSASSFLWLRTDLYVHNGVEMRPLSDEELAAGERGVGGKKDDHEAIHNDDRIVTVVPSAERDFRGILGDLERATAAYKDMHAHEHRDPAQALPLFRLMTWLDPQFVMAWVTGATVIARDRSERGTEKALAFLKEAEENNPTSVAVPTEYARLLVSRRRDLSAARGYLEVAMKRGLGQSARLPEIEKEGLILASRLLALVYRDEGDLVDLRKHLDASRKVMPDDPILKRLRDDLQNGKLSATSAMAPNETNHEHGHDHDAYSH